MGVLIDTDVLIEYLRNNEEIVKRLAGEYWRENHLCYSPVTKAEIIAGLRKGEEVVTLKLFSLMKCLKIDGRMGQKAGEYMKAFRASHNVEIADALIASAAFEHDVPLWTLNKKHYPMKDIEFYA